MVVPIHALSSSQRRPTAKDNQLSPDLKDILIATIPSIIPSFLVGFGILINKNDTNRLSGEIAGLRTELHSSIARVDSRIDALGKQLSDAIVMLVNIGNDLDKRITRLEDKG